jgi:tetratricopeptide (TPR) repeat protein
MIDEPNDDWIEAFNEAAHLARALEHTAARAAYGRLVEEMGRHKLTGDAKKMLVTAKMRAAFCAMDEHRYDVARALLEAAARDQRALDDDGRYELHFALGNTLGNLGRMDEMFSAFIRAISAAEDADDYEVRPAACWSSLLQHAAEHRAWAFLAAKAEIALHAARVRGIEHLEAVAAVRIDEARRQMM